MDLKLKGWPTVEDLSKKKRREREASGNHGNNDYASPIIAPAVPAINMTESWVQETAKYQYSTPNNKPLQNMNSDSPHNLQGQGQRLNPASPTSSYQPPSFSKYDYDSERGRYSSNQSDNYSKGTNQSEHYNRGGYSYNNQPYPQQPSSGHRDDSSLSKNLDSPRKYERRSLPPKLLVPTLNDYQNYNELKKPSDMTPPMETEESDNFYKPQENSPTSPPPAPPRRDMSSLKYVQHPTKNHEKYPSWPVTQPNIENDTNNTVHTQVGAHPVKDNTESPPGGQYSYKPQLKPLNEGPSPSVERRSSDENSKRNQSDPGFNKPNKFVGLSIKRPTPQEIQNSQKPENLNSKQKQDYVVEDFLKGSPGYPKPLMDQDGNRIGDAKYNVPSPPERDHPGLDQKTLQEKIANIVSPPSEQKYSMEGNRMDSYRTSLAMSRDNNHSSAKFQFNSRPQQSASTVSKIDSSTSPVQSPTEPKYFPAPVEGKDRPSEHIQHYTGKNSHIMVKQMLCYNTGTQTDTNGRQMNRQSTQSTQVFEKYLPYLIFAHSRRTSISTRFEFAQLQYRLYVL